jgi:hypothetical protein
VFQNVLRQLTDPRALQLAVGALIGTVLTLGYSLSIIPIQRAAEIYTPSIVRLFRDARSIRFPFLALLSLCLLSFASVLSPVINIAPTNTVPILIIFLGAALDLVRQLFRSVTRLLEPKEAVWRLEREARRALERLHRGFERVAELSWRALPPEKQAEHTKEQYLKWFYASSSGYGDVVDSSSGVLTEIAQKAIARADLSLTFEAINALRQLAVDSIEIRKTALTYMSMDIFVVKTNAEKQLDSIYQNLLAVNRSGVRRGSENVSIWVIRTLGSLAQHMLTVRQEPPFEHFSSLAISPISYCKMAIRDAMGGCVDDAGYMGAATLSGVSCNAPAAARALDVHLQTVDGIFQIVRSFITSPGKAIHVNEPLKRGLEVLRGLCERNDLALDRVLRSFLDELQSFVPVATVLETGQFGELLHLPLAPAYDPTFECSLPCLVQRSTALVREDAAHPWVDPWRDFLELGEGLSRHFRSLSENPGLAASQMMFYLIQSLQMIGSVYLKEIQRARREHSKSISEIEGQLGWYLSFFWSSAKSAKAMKFQWTENAVKCLGWIGLAALNGRLDETARSAVENIASVTKSAAEKIQNVGSHELARLLMPMRLMMHLATKLGIIHMVRQIQGEEDKVMAELAGYTDLKPILDRCVRDCLHELAYGRRLILDPNDPESLLLQILNQRAQDAAKERGAPPAASEPQVG